MIVTPAAAARSRWASSTSAAIRSSRCRDRVTRPRSLSASTSPCRHDSGGPYVRELPDGTVELVAVVSAGPDCPHSGWEFSARVDTVRPWIDDVLAGAEVNDDLALESSMLLLAAGAALSLLLLLATRRRRHRRRSDRTPPTEPSASPDRHTTRTADPPFKRYRRTQAPVWALHRPS